MPGPIVSGNTNESCVLIEYLRIPYNSGCDFLVVALFRDYVSLMETCNNINYY